MNCCDDYSRCTQGPACPACPDHATPLVTANSDGSSPHEAPGNAPWDWLAEVRHWARIALLAGCVAGTLGLLAGYHFGR